MKAGADDVESGLRPAAAPQCARTVLLVRPAAFYANPETLVTNAFQHAATAMAQDTLAAAQAEFDGAVTTLLAAGVNVAVAEAEAAADTPDALYPNNWFSTHPDGRVLLYPMAVPSRRRERRPELLRSLAARHGWRIERIVDLTVLENDGLVVEGTGSLVIDHAAKLAYAALSARTHAPAVTVACRELGLEAVTFHAHDRQGRAVYHTNVLMSVGPALVVLASTLVQPGGDLARVFDALERTDKQLLDVTADQVEHFAGNVLFLDGGAAGPVCALSRRAWASLARPQRQLLERHAEPVPCAVDTIEHVGGGGIRCMIAEIFLPQAAPDAVRARAARRLPSA